MSEIVISFALLDDLKDYRDPPTFQTIPNSLEDVKKFIRSIQNTIDADPTYTIKREVVRFIGQVGWNEAEICNIAEKLYKDKYYVLNRVEKYYVIAFAINYTRFEVFSKDCDKELIKWRDNDENDPIVKQIDDPDYNENPVIAFLKAAEKRN